MALIYKYKKTEESEVEKIAKHNAYCLSVMKMTAKNTYDLLWLNKNKTPQDICNSLGAEAVKAFELHGALQELIYSLDNSWVPLVPLKKYTKNENGTVSIVE